MFAKLRYPTAVTLVYAMNLPYSEANVLEFATFPFNFSIFVRHGITLIHIALAYEYFDYIFVCCGITLIRTALLYAYFDYTFDFKQINGTQIIYCHHR